MDGQLTEKEELLVLRHENAKLKSELERRDAPPDLRDPRLSPAAYERKLRQAVAETEHRFGRWGERRG